MSFHVTAIPNGHRDGHRVTLPVILIFLLAQKYIIQGIVTSGLK